MFYSADKDTCIQGVMFLLGMETVSRQQLFQLKIHPQGTTTDSLILITMRI